jgi:hypothetical protein
VEHSIYGVSGKSLKWGRGIEEKALCSLSKVPVDLNQNNTVSREELGSSRDEISDKSFECNPIYRRNGTLLSKKAALHYRPITKKVTAF